VAAPAAAVADPKIVSDRYAAYTMTRAKSIITRNNMYMCVYYYIIKKADTRVRSETKTYYTSGVSSGDYKNKTIGT